MDVLQNEERLERLRAVSCDEELLAVAEEFGV